MSKIILQPVHGIEIEVIGGLIEEQSAGIAEERLREEHANFLTASQLAHLALLQRALYTETVEKNAGIRFGCVAAFFADDAFKLTETHAVRVGESLVGLGVERVAFPQGVPEEFVAHDDGIDYAKVVEGELILAQDAHFLGRGDGAFGGLEFAGENLHECGLTGAVGAGDGVAAAGHEGAGDVLEEDARAEAHGDVIDREHNLSIVP